MCRFNANIKEEMTISQLAIAGINFDLAKENNKKFFIRIDDSYGYKEEKEKELFLLLNLCKIEGQKHYLSDILKFAQSFCSQLLSQKKAYLCFCELPYHCSCQNLSDEEVLNNNKKFKIKLKKPKNDIKFDDYFHNSYKFTSSKIDDFVILEQNNIPSQIFQNAIFDMIENITLFLSDMKALDFAREIHIFESIGFENESKCIFADKLVSPKLKNLLEDGFLPAALLKYAKSMYLKHDNLSQIHARNFDLDELKELNISFLKELDENELCKMIGYKNCSFLAKKLLDKSATLNELKENIQTLFARKNINEELKSAIVKYAFIEDFDRFINSLQKDLKSEKSQIIKDLQKHLPFDLRANFNIIQAHLKEIFS